jgi:hypothetical protein
LAPVVALLALLVGAFLWPLFQPLLVPHNGLVRMGADIFAEFYPQKHFLRESLRAGHLPLRNPYTFSGTPFLANCQVSALFYPDVALWLLLPLPWGFAVDQALHLLLAGVGMALLVRDYTQSRPAALAAAISFIFGSFFLSKVLAGHLPLMQTMTWLPWLMLCYERAIARDRFSRWSLAASLLLALSLLAGYPELDLIIVVALVARLVWEWPARRGSRAPLLANTLLPILLAAGVAAIQLVPTLEFISQSLRFDTVWETIRGRSLPPANLLTLLMPDVLGNVIYHNTVEASMSFDTAAYSGVVSVVLGGAALYVTRDRRARFYGALAVLGVFLALGGYNPLYRVLWVLPGLHQVAMPGRFITLWVFALPVLAGFGVRLLLDPGAAPRRVRSAGLGALVVGAAGLLGWAAMAAFHARLADYARRAILARYPSPAGPLSKIDSLLATQAHGLVIFGVLTLCAGGLLLACRDASPASRSRLAYAAVLLALCDLAGLNFKYVAGTGLGAPEAAGGYAAVLAADPEPHRVMPLPGNGILTNGYIQTHTPSVLGYDPIILADYMRYLAAADGVSVTSLDPHQPMISHYDSPLIDRLNAKYVLSSGTLTDPALTLVSDSEPKIYRKAHYAPRAYLVHDVETQPDVAQALARLARTDYGRLATVSSGDVPSQEPTSPEGVPTFTEPSPETIVVHAAPKAAGLLVISETYDRDWRAVVDGRPTPVLKADVVLCGVALTAGPHVVELEYRPLSLPVGALISLASLLVVAAAGWGLSRERRRNLR